MRSETEHKTSAKTRDLHRRFARLAILNIIANITVPLASLVDTALLGHLESNHLLWASLAAFMLARTVTLWRAAASFSSVSSLASAR